MHNTGDIGAAFSWNIEKFQPDFSIAPVKGYISPGMEVSFEIIFHPTVVNHDIRYEVNGLLESIGDQLIVSFRVLLFEGR